MQPPRLVMVTGAPRSGTTVVGELLSTAPRTGELYEPMNASVGDRAVTNQFEIPGSRSFSTDDAESFIDRVEARRLLPRKASAGRRNPYLNRTNRTVVQDRLSLTRRTTIWKDPFAFFLTPQVAARGTIPVVVTVRDPLSLAGSFKRMRWSAPVTDLVGRMREAGLSVADAAADKVHSASGHAESAAILWNLYHSTLLEWLERGLDVLPVDMIQLIESPADVRARLTAHCRVPIAVRERTLQAPATDEALPDKAHVKNRSASSITDYWKRVLDEDEIAFSRDMNWTLWERLSAAMAKSGRRAHD